MVEVSERRRHAIALFAPLGPTYERVGSLLSFGQDPRWRTFLVSRLDVDEDAAVLDVATGTGAVARELVRRHGCRVVGLDQSTTMLEEARRSVPPSVDLIAGDADHLPFEEASFDALTFTYLLRYVDDPPATMRELARVVKPGGSIAGLEFAVPTNGAARAAWEAYVRVGLPLAGRAISSGWGHVGSFLGDSIRSFWARHPLDEQLAWWTGAGIADVRTRRLSLGGGIVTWGTRA